jgi:hypothetical protein
MTNNCSMDGSNMGRVQGKLVGYSKDRPNVTMEHLMAYYTWLISH